MKSPRSFYQSFSTVIPSTMLALSFAFAAQRAVAQPLTDSLAISFKQRGDHAIAESKYAEAVAAYQKGDQIQHHPSFDFNLARALQGLGRFAEALEALERFDREASTELKEQVPGLADLLSQLRENVGELLLEGADHSARVSGNGQDLGPYRPGATIRYNRGPLDLLVEAEGFKPISKRVMIEPGRAASVKLEWIAIDYRARVTVRASVAAANLFVDGRLLGQTPIDVRLAAGAHRLRLEHPDCHPLETEVSVTERESRTLTLDLSRHAPIWSKWWFWTGAAAVVTGLVVTGIALSTSKSPESGDIQPGIVSAPIMAPR
jgi:hypothetical protein